METTPLEIHASKTGLSFSEPTASISLISPDNYREFIAPYHKEPVEYFKAKKTGTTAATGASWGSALASY